MQLRYPEDKNGSLSYKSYPQRLFVDINNLYESNNIFYRQMKIIEDALEKEGLIDYSKLVKTDLS